MKIKKIEFQNIFSFGNKKMVVDYDNLGDGSLNMILGKNGCGKSSFIKLHKLALYFDADGVTMDSIANDINGNGFLSIDIESKGNDWRIESEYTRTKLSTIRVYKNGIEQDWGKIPDTKKMIKSDVVDIPYHIFSNILSLSVNDFKSFLSMSPKDTRNIRDRIFGFYVLNDMMESLKLSLKSQSEIHKTNLLSLQSLEETRDDLRAEIEELEANSDSREKIDELEGKIEEKKAEIKETDETISDLENKRHRHLSYENKRKNEKLKEDIQRLSEDISKINEYKDSLEEESEESKKKLSEVSSKIALHSKHREYARKVKAMEEAEKLQGEIDALKSEISTHEERLSVLISERSVYHVKQDIRSKINESDHLRETITSLVKEKEDLEKDKDDAVQKRDDAQKTVDDLSTKIADLHVSYKSIKRKKETYESGHCDQCGSEFKDPQSLSKIGEFEDELENIESRISELEESKKEYRSIVSEYNEKITNLTSRIRNIDTDIEDSKIGVEDIDKEISTLLLQNDLSQEDVLESSENVDYDTPIDELKSKISEKKSLRDSQISKMNYIIDQVSDVEDSDVEIPEESEEELIGEKSYLESIREKYNEDIRQKIEEISHKNLAMENAKMRLIDGDFEDFTESDLLPDSEFSQIDQKIRDFSKKINTLKSEISEIKIEISKINVAEESQIEAKKSVIKKYDDKLEETRENIKRCYKSIRFYNVMENIISDDGVKSYIIRNVVPYINKSVNDILSNLEIPLVVRFDDNFKPSIFRFGKQVSTSSISTGQTKMIDSAIIFTITKFLISKCGGINIVFYDEIFSSLHTSAVSQMMEIIHRELKAEMKLHVFLVNHSFISSSFFDNIFELEMVDHFSRLQIRSIDEYNQK
jgi:DNA repair exonuclease SbcCD ATPase subunit|uniref:STRUCTURAL MAINTENANCE OF CHROMOSOMES PROTEIN n=1 Tax=Ackermannviridae sp. TaxID=2831612 RepID=A0A8S5VU25_9CAUD|nr:MAG TPA: STRUCTURAL MAINTENANCE OF CHROMOSOMES PROTEIN [Ackermannviridae sp.]